MRIAILALVLLAGCAGDQANRQDLGAIAASRVGLGVPVDTENRPPVIVEKPVPDPRIEAVQQSLTGLGLQFNKVADEASAVKATATATATAVADLKAKLEVTAHAIATLTANANVDADVRVKLFESLDLLRGAVASLEVQVKTQGAAMVGLQNTLNQVTHETRAGRDAYVTQFTGEMERVLTKSFDATVTVVYLTAGGAFGVLTTLITTAAWIVVRSKEQSRARAREEADENWKIAERYGEDYRAIVGLILTREKERDEHEERMGKAAKA